MISIEVVGKVESTWGEGPVWWKGALYYVDIEGHLVHRYSPETGEESSWKVGQRVGTVVPRENGGLIIAGDNGMLFLDPASGDLAPIADPEPEKPDNRFNDGKCSPDGRLFAGTISLVKKEGDAKLYRLDPDLTLHEAYGPVTNSNGIVWSADGGTCFYIDTPSKEVKAFDYSEGELSNMRVVVSTKHHEASPDGMTIDADGNLWIAFCHGACVACFDPRSGEETPENRFALFGNNRLRLRWPHALGSIRHHRCPQIESGRACRQAFPHQRAGGQRAGSECFRRVKRELILASGSPRRRDLLEAAGLEFDVIPSPAEEIYDISLGMTGLCEENARLKAVAVAAEHPDAIVIGADTLVFLDGEPLGKPRDLEDARVMLGMLSGRKNQVCTGVCVAGPRSRSRCFHGVTDVFFRKLTEADIEGYLAKTNPLDKAGAYGIQDHGEMIVDRIEGDFDNVMGLPVALVLDALR